jgi:hypothetical protein
MTRIATLAGLAALLAVAGSAMAAAPALADGTLTVVVQGRGDVTGSGISCNEGGGDCEEAYEDTQECDPDLKPPCHDVPAEAVVTAANRSGTGFVFDHWNGCDDEFGSSCDVFLPGNRTVTAVFRDNQAPGVSLLEPATTAARRGVIALGASASDNAGVAGVEFRVRGVLVGARDTSAPYGTTFDTTSIADGSAAVTATAFDSAGNSSAQSRTITIDNTSPGLTVSGPDGATFGPGTTQTWTVGASDATTGPPSVQCSVAAAGSGPSYGACSGGSGSHSVSNLPEGSYTLSVKATDGAGNTTETTRTFAIDATAPQTSITGGPADGSSSTATSATFTFASDEGGSTFECRVYPAALTPGAFGPCTGAGSHSASGFSPGTYAFEVRATDAYGNVDASPAKRTFTVTSSSTGGTGGTGGTTGGGTTGGGGPTGGGSSSGGSLADGRIEAKVRTFWLRFGKRTRVGTLTVSNAPVGATVTLKCKGKRCTFKKRVLKMKGAKLALAKRFKKRKLPAGTVISIVITKDGWVGKSFRYTLRAGKFPKLVIS